MAASPQSFNPAQGNRRAAALFNKTRHPTAIRRQIEFELPSRRGFALTFGRRMKTAAVALISAVVTSLLWAAGIAIVYFYFLGSPPPFQVRVDAPRSASVDDPVEIAIHATNPSAEEMVLDSVDIYSSLLEGFDLMSVTPTPNSKEKVLDFQSLSFSRSVAPNETLTVIVSMKAKKEGYFAGDIDVCTPAQEFTTVSTGILITKPNKAVQ